MHGKDLGAALDVRLVDDQLDRCWETWVYPTGMQGDATGTAYRYPVGTKYNERSEASREWREVPNMYWPYDYEAYSIW